MTQPATNMETPDERGLGALNTDRGNLPLEDVTIFAQVAGLVAQVVMTQTYRNPFDIPLEATYIFPLPDRAALTDLRLEVGGRTVIAELAERGMARAAYVEAIAAGQRAAIAEEERPGVFTLRVGTILAGEQATVRLTLVQPMPYSDGEAELRFPLVVAPRYIPGTVKDERPVGTGWAQDTDATPDASRITPPVLLPGFPYPVRLAVTVDIDPAGFDLQYVRAAPEVFTVEGTRLQLKPGQRLDQDLIIRCGYGRNDAPVAALNVGDGTFHLTLLPAISAHPPRPRDVVLLLDRSGSMSGWQMVAARRAAARIVDTLTTSDRFAVISFNDEVDGPSGAPEELSTASDRNRFHAVEHLARLEAAGGTEMVEPLRRALKLLSGTEVRDRVLVLVTDGQVGNEDQILGEVGQHLGRIRVHTIGVDRAVNAGFLARLAVVGGGRCELVESEDRLDHAAEQIHSRISTPLLTDVTLTGAIQQVSPARIPALFPGVPLVVTGRTAGDLTSLVISGRTADGESWSREVPATSVPDDTLTKVWARSRIRDLEDAYAAQRNQALVPDLVSLSLTHHVLCRFTAFVAVDEVIASDGIVHRVTQPVEPVGEPISTAMPVAMMAAPRSSMGASAMRVMPKMVAKARSFGGAIPRVSVSRRTSVAGPAMPAPMPTPEVREVPTGLVQMELDRLTELAEQPSAIRRVALADLSTRLLVVAAEFGTDRASEISEMAKHLAECDNPSISEADLEELWERVVALLHQLLK